MICEDANSKQIAAELNMSLGTVTKYRTQITEKAGVKSTAGLIMFAITNGIYRPKV